MANILGGLLSAPMQLMQMPLQMMGGLLGGNQQQQSGGLGGLLGGGGGLLGGFGGMLGSGLTSMIMPLVIMGVGIMIVFKLVDKI
jgi:hypothetical protein